MLEKLFQAIMRRYFGQFLTGIENVELTFWSGKINLNNIALKHEKINQLLKAKNIPFTIKYSHIGSLSIDIPWKSLSSTPVEVKISDVYIVLKMDKYTSVSRKIEEEKLSLIKNYIQYLIRKSLEVDKTGAPDSDEGYFKKMMLKIVHNLNAEVKNISIRMVSETETTAIKEGERESEHFSSESFMSLKSGTDLLSGVQRRASETNSQYMRRNQKYFALGFCIEQFNLSTVDQNFNKTFYNLDNKKSPVRKVMTMKQISAYLEEESKFNIFKVSQEKKNQFMKSTILRQKHRLLCIDGRIVMNRNVEKEQFYDYLLSTHLQMLEVRSTYGQLKQIIKIFANFATASQTKEIKKLSQVDEVLQQEMKPEFIVFFPKLHETNYDINSIDEKFGKMLCSVSKKNILCWTKQCAISIIKETKVQMVRKEKNKKGWLNYIISQSEVDLTDKEVSQIYHQVQDMIKTIEYEKKTAMRGELILSKIVFLLSHQELEQRISLQLQNTSLHYIRSATTNMHVSLSIDNISLNYVNQKLKINTPLLMRGFCEMDENLLLIQFKQEGNKRKVTVEVAQLELNHENHVLLLISELIKLRAKEEMKSDIKLKKAELAQTKNIEQELGKNYVIDVRVNKISFKIQVNESSHILVSLNSIDFRTDESAHHHVGSLKNFNINYVTVNKKSTERDHVNSILKDFSIVFNISSYFNKIYTKMEQLQISICEADLHSIYRGFTKQSEIFKAEKIEQKNKRIHESSYMRGHLKLLTIMKSWKEYEGVLTDQGLYFFEEDLEDDEDKRAMNNDKYSHHIPLNNCSVTMLNEEQFKIESDAVNQLIECRAEQLHKWVDYIEKIVFQSSSKLKMYKMMEKQQDRTSDSKSSANKVKYETQVVFEFTKIEVLVSEHRQKNLLRMGCDGITVVLKENELQYQRTVCVEDIVVRKLENNIQTEANTLLKNRRNQTRQPIKILLRGKKKLHPEYRGEVEIGLAVPYIKINYDAEFLYRMIRKIAWGHEIPSFTNQMRNTKVLELVKQFLQSTVYEKREEGLKSKGCCHLDNFYKYSEINRYRAEGHKCLVLLNVKMQLQQVSVNLFNGINNLCAFNVKGENLAINLDKGSQFLFFKLTATNFELYDCSNYPHTNTKPFKISSLYPLLHRKENADTKQAVECYFSKFDLDTFINKSRIKSFFFLELYDMQLNFQNQLINRFFDYLLNQIIGFILAPHTLHKYDGPRRGPYLYQYSQSMTEKEVRELISDSLQPFFNKMFINAYNLRVKFNSFPQLEGFNLDFQSVKIETHNYEKGEKIRFNPSELNKVQKHPVYKELIKIPGFQEKLLKSHWVSRMNICAEGGKSVIFGSEVPTIETYIQRTLNAQKQTLFPFVMVDTSLFCESYIKNLSIRAPKHIYNLINKCMMHNVSYDDQQDLHYTHNYQFKNLIKPSELFYKLKADSLEIIVPEIKTVIAIPDFEYKFIRHPSMIKEMLVEGRSLNIFKNNEIIMMSSEYKDKNNKDINGLSYKIEMKLNGEKPMQAKLSYIDIQYNLPFFLEFVQYTILDQSCYPPLPPGTIINQLPDLPALSCKVHLDNSRIKLVVPNSQNDDQFICSGNISLLWLRNSLPHPEKYANNPENFPQGREWCSYRIELKNMQIRKHYQMKSFNQQQMNTSQDNVRTSYYNNQAMSRGRYRSISNKISLVFRISQLMKLAPNQRDRYNDNIFDVKITQLWLKLSHVDIEHLKSVFAKQQPQARTQPSEKQAQMNMIEQSQSEVLLEPRVEPPPVPVAQPPATYTTYSKYSIDINLIHIQLGLSELPVPLLDFMIKQAKSNIEILGSNVNGEFKTTIMANCWNMLIGRWQPIIQQLSPALSFRLGKDKYLLLDCSKMLLFNVSLESLKILKLISSDFGQKGKFSISQILTGEEGSKSDNKIKGINVSPYVLTNRTGITFQVLSQLSETKTKLKPGEKTYVDLKNYDLDFSEKLKVFIELEGSTGKIEIDMDLATCKKINIEYKNRSYQLLLKPISNSIMKEIIISSLFVIENKTSYAMSFYYNCGLDEEEKDTYEGRLKVLPKEKTALKFTANIKNVSSKGPQKQLKLDFPELQKYQIENNFEFPYEAILHDYEHRIDLNRRSFNCIVGRREEIETMIVVEPSFYVKNLMPVPIRIQFVVDRVSKTEKAEICSFQLGVNQEKDIYDFNSKDKIQVRLKVPGFNISSFQSITALISGQQEYKSYLDLVDYRGHGGKIAMKIIKHNKVRKMYIFSEAVLINQTNYNWFVFSSSKLMPGQRISDIAEQESPYTFIAASQYESLNFGFSDDTPFTSGEIKISELGIHNMTMYKNSLLYEFTIKCTFHCLENEALIYSYVLKSEPRYVFVNETTCIVEIKQENTEDKSEQIKVGERLNWVWPVRTEPKNIQLRVCQNEIQLGNSEWLYSSPLVITKEDIEQTVIVLRPKQNSNDKKLLKIIPMKQSQSNYFLIEEVTKVEDYLVTINNELEQCKLRAHQECIDSKNPSWYDHKSFEINPKQSIPFGWDYPNADQILNIEISFMGYLRTKFDPHSIIVSLEKQKVEQLLIANEDGETQAITVKIEIIGLRKKITFSKKEAFEEEDSQLEMMHTGNRFAFSFTQIGVSIISSVKKRSQLLFLNLKKLEIIMMQKKSSRSLQVKVKYINIDNNYNHNTIYPILLTPLKHEKTLKKSRPFFVLLLEQTLDSKDIIEIKQLRICNEPLSIKIHDEVLTAVLEMVQEINKQTDKSQGQIDLLPIFRSTSQHMEWQQSKLVKPQRDIFFREFEIAKLELQLTFSIRPKLNANNFIIMTILSSFGAAISNVSEAQLTLSRFLKKDKGLSELKAELADFYLMQFMKGIYKVLGSINLFGNPYVFIRLVAEGAWEIVNQPTEGFIKGPVQGAIGIVKGGVYFTRNIVAGTCNSFEAISQSISRGVSYMTMDEKFIERRQKIKIQKSSHFFKGLQYGAFSIYTGLQVAITGLVRHPAEGYRSNGFLGGLTGTLKGFAGLFTKPVSGTFEGISKISQGIKNTALMFQDGPNSKRIRPPRLFFSELAYYKNYNIFESTAIAILQFCSTKYLNESINYVSLMHNEQKKEVHAYVLTQRFFCHVDILNNKLVSEVEIGNIKELKIQENRLHILTHRDMIVADGENYHQLFEAFHKYYFYDL